MAFDASGVVASMQPPPRSRKGAARAASQKAAAPKLSAKAQERQQSLYGLIQLGHLGLMMMRQKADAKAVQLLAPAIADEAIVIAETNTQWGEAIDKLNKIGPYGAIVMPVLALTLQVAVNHDVLPGDGLSALGVVSRDALEAEVRKDEAEAKAYYEALKKEAEEAAAEYARENSEDEPSE
jgi:hypothetical protein